MGMFKASIKRSNGKVIRKEDDLSHAIEEYCENQKVKSYDIERTGLDFIVTMDGDVHIYPDDLTPNGTLPFKLGKVTGNLIVHNERSINPDLIPEQLDGQIIIDVESLMPNQSVRSSQTEQDDEIGRLYENFNIVPPGPEAIHKGILSYLVDAEEEMTIKNLQEILDKANELRNRTYGLDVKFITHGRCQKPEFSIIDIERKTSPMTFTLEPKHAAVYLSFLCLDGKISLERFCQADGLPYIRCDKIYLWLTGKGPGGMENISIKATDGAIEKKKKIDTLTEYISKIRGIIADASPNDRVARQFVIYEKPENNFSISGTTDHIRKDIKKTLYLP